ncbi:hypothetical protein V6N13_001374 [Hibiscus sabdariffa]|uniref:SCP domain-containing protein n=1 Tax=Hibiscus sabdariffa TaxID=183260 RepID=A0ABR2G862_9ROSI
MLFTKLFLCLCFTNLKLFPLTKAQNSPDDILKAHNEIRAEVGVSPLVWNETLAAYAQDYAEKRKGDCGMEYSTGAYGENLASGDGSMNIADAVKFWAEEKSDYDHASNKCISGGTDCFHYTQVVSRLSTSVGCAKTMCVNGWDYVICTYFPPGNIDGQRPY